MKMQRVGGESPSYMWRSHSATDNRSSHVWPRGKGPVAHFMQHFDLNEFIDRHSATLRFGSAGLRPK